MVLSSTRYAFSFPVVLSWLYIKLTLQSYPSTLGTPGNGVALSVRGFLMTGIGIILI